jgi:hypothetical protein
MEEHEERAYVILPEGAQTHVEVVVRTADGGELVAGVELSTRTWATVADDADLQSVIDRAPAGAWLTLAAATFKGSFRIDKDLVLLGAEGSRGTSLDGTSGSPVLEISNGASVSLRDLTIWAESSAPVFSVTDADLELLRVRTFGGLTAVSAANGTLGAANSQILGTESLVSGTRLVATFRNCVLGWPTTGWSAMLTGGDHQVRFEGSVLSWPWEDQPTTECDPPCTASAWRSFLIDADLDSESILDAETLVDHPGFLVPPEEVATLQDADLRLLSDGPAVGFGLPGELDPDGSAADAGIYGGPDGDWPDVDNDRDGFTNLEGDCDDQDPNLVPDPHKPWLCGDQACGGCAAGGVLGGQGAAVLLAALAWRRRRGLLS